ncbi:MAG: SPASM domain-containing protein [Bacteroidales bacterium]|nr:SPASM domain-containing protein [Bacteroidales bacterium]
MRRNHLEASLAITTTVGCRNLCTYCPQKVFLQAYKKRSDITSMSMETFVRCLSALPGDLCLSFSGFSEPWQNPRCTDMVLYASEKGFPVRVNTTLIGLQPEDIIRMASVPFLKFVIHLPDDQGQTRIKVDENYLTVVEQLASSPLSNLFWKFHRSSPGINIHPGVLPLLDGQGSRMMLTGLNNRAGHVDSGTARKLPNKGKVLQDCQDFRHNILLPNGEVALCHMDWSLKHILGNLLEESYAQIHAGKEFSLLKSGLPDTRSEILCRSCEKDIVKRSLAQRMFRYVSKQLTGYRDPY